MPSMNMEKHNNFDSNPIFTKPVESNNLDVDKKTLESATLKSENVDNINPELLKAVTIELFGENEKQKIQIEDYKKTLSRLEIILKTFSHDLRSPTGNLATFLEVILKDLKEKEKEKKGMTSEETEKLTQNIEMTSKASKDLYNMLVDMLFWAKEKSGGKEFEKKDLKLKEEIERATAPLLGVMNNKNIKLSIDVNDNVKVKTSSCILQIAIRNLFSNAIKFTKRDGEIKIFSKLADNKIKIFVTDNGIGMTDKQKENIFKVYDEKVTNIMPGTENESGTGLGFTLFKEDLEKLGGTLTVKSELEKGSTFIITLPKEKE